MSTLQLNVKPLGLLNRPNQYGIIPVGAMFDALNVFLRKPGVLSPQPQLLEWSNTTFSFATGDEAALVAPTDIPGQTDQRVLMIVATTGGNDFVVWFAANGTLGFASWTETSTGAIPRVIPRRCKYVKHKNRFFVLSTIGTQVFDVLTPSTTAERQSRYAGMQPVVFATFGAITTTGGWFPSNSWVAYRTVFSRKYADGYELISQPSSGEIVANGGGGAAVVRITVTIPSTLIPGLDTVEIYRTRTRAAGTDTGPTYMLVASIPVTASNVGTSPTFDDGTPETGLGEELYTNPGAGQGGEQFDNRQPPVAKCIAMFKGYAIYANLTQPPKLTLNIPAFSGSPADAARVSAIGARLVVGGTSTSGSPTITGISAADMVGLAIGQQYSGVNFVGDRRIVSLGATTITLDGNASVSGAHNFNMIDVLFYRRGGSGSWNSVFMQAGAMYSNFRANGFIVYASRASGGLAGTSVPVTVALEPDRWITVGDGSFEVVATNGQNYAPKLLSPPAFPVSAGLTGGLKVSPTSQPNSWQWSKVQEPELCPATQTKFCGSGDILDLASTRDACFFTCSDGLWRLSGDGTLGADGFNWRLDPVDSTLTPTGPRTTGVMRDNVYQYGPRGLIRVSSDRGIEMLSIDRINELQGSPYAEEQPMLLVCDETNNEVWFSFNPQTGDDWFVYNASTNAFTKADRTAAQIVTAAGFVKMAFNSGQGGIEFAGKNVAGTATLLKHLAAVSPVYQAAQLANFMPIFGKSPTTVKQWQRATHLFANLSPAQPIVALWNEAGAPSAITPAGQVGFADMRATVWTPMAAAVAPAIKVGYSTQSAAGYYEYLGFSIEFEELTAQQRAR
jgi:hypothetical protein